MIVIVLVLACDYDYDEDYDYEKPTFRNRNYLRRPVTLVYSEIVETEGETIRRERQIKGWTRAKKEALIAGDKDRLRRLSKRRN